MGGKGREGRGSGREGGREGCRGRWRCEEAGGHGDGDGWYRRFGGDRTSGSKDRRPARMAMVSEGCVSDCDCYCRRWDPRGACRGRRAADIKAKAGSPDLQNL
jgi:hypothetical protein